MSKFQKATASQMKHAVMLIDQQGLDVRQMEGLLLYLPHLGEGVKGGTIPPLDDFRGMFGLPPKLQPTIIELGEFVANYDEPIATKIAGNADPKRIGWHNRDWATDEKFPDTRTGKKRYKASAVHFGKLMPDEDVAKWCVANNKIRATPKEGIDLALVSPRPKLDKVMPLAIAGQFFVGGDGDRFALCFDLVGDERYLRDVWLGPGEQWSGRWFFLVLEELPSVA